jgi:hypothetical protein
MRRRLWWAMCSADTRATEDHGISLAYSDRSFDTHYPLNVDDSELSLDMQKLPVAKHKWTEMTFSLIITEITGLLQRLYQRPATPPDGLSSETSGNQITNDLITHFETTYLQYCDPNIPIQQATLLMSRLMIGKLTFAIRNQSLKRSGFEKDTPGATEENLDAACQVLEIDLQLQQDDILGNFRWLFETYTQYHMLTYVLWHLYVNPVGPSVARAWNVVNQSFEIAGRRGVSVETGSKWEVLHLLKGKAMKIRSSQNMEPSLADAAMDDLSASRNLTGEFGDSLDFTFGDASDWNMSAIGFPDWDRLMGNFTTRGYET